MNEAAWRQLTASPLTGLLLTLGAYLIAIRIAAHCRNHPLANPVALSVAIVCAVLAAGGIPYEDYFTGGYLVHLLLGPATVALAVPLAAQAPRLKRSAVPLLCGVAAGTLTALVSAVLLTDWLGASAEIAASAAPKSVTMPIALALSETLGGLVPLTAALVMATGIFGALVAPMLFDAMGVRSHTVRGLALGVASHGIGTARALQIGPEMGAFAGLGMGLAGMLAAVLAPWLVPELLAWLR